MDIDALLKEIETENDWPEEATVFKQIEKSLSCAICHGTLKAAVLLSKCGHSFCSYCIRQYLAHDQFCPLCRKPASQSDIIRNITVIEIADTFRENRKALLQLCKQLVSPPLPNPSTNQQKEKESNNNEETDEKSRVSLKRSSTSESSKNETSSSTTQSNKDIIAITDSDSDSDFEDNSNIKRRKSNSTCLCECPICGEFFNQSCIEAHASTCDGTIPTKPNKQFNGFVSTPAVLITQPLPNLCYKLMKTQEIKKQLQKYSLSTSGSRDVLIERLRQFTIRYNAELDNAHPLPVWKVAQIVMSHEENCKTKKYFVCL